MVIDKQQNQYTLKCLNGSLTRTCTKDNNYLQTFKQDKEKYYSSSPASTCPEHFRWIPEDVKPWKSTGITREMVESGKNISQLRIVIKKGKVYVAEYGDTFETRDLFSVWGVLFTHNLFT